MCFYLWKHIVLTSLKAINLVVITCFLLTYFHRLYLEKNLVRGFEPTSYFG